MAPVTELVADWLNLPRGTSEITRYELFGLENFEADLANIATQADRVIVRVRAVRPGPNAKAWSTILDLLAISRALLSNAEAKAAYDVALRRGEFGSRLRFEDLLGIKSEEGGPDSEEGAEPNRKKDRPKFSISDGSFGSSPSGDTQGPAETEPPGWLEGWDSNRSQDPVWNKSFGNADQVGYQPSLVALPELAGVVPYADTMAPEPPISKPIATFEEPSPVVWQSKGRVRRHTGALGIGAICVLCLLIGGGIVYFLAGNAAAPTTLADSTSGAPLREPQQNSRPPDQATIPTPRSESEHESEVVEVEPNTKTAPRVVPETAGDPESPSAPENPAMSIPTTPPTMEEAPSFPMVSADDARVLSEKAKTVCEFFVNGKFDDGNAMLGELEGLAKSPRSFAVVDRLRLLCAYRSEFHKAFSDCYERLNGGDAIKMPSGQDVAVVEANKGQLVIRAQGKNLRYARNAIPAGLMLAIWDQLRTDDGPNALAKAAYLILRAEAKEKGFTLAASALDRADAMGVDSKPIRDALVDIQDGFPPSLFQDGE